MKKSNELREKLVATFADKKNWNRLIDIDGEKYIYISAVNEVRREVKQPSGTIATLVGCFTLVTDHNTFIWCC